MIRLVSTRESTHGNYKTYASALRSKLETWGIELASHPKAGWFLFVYAILATALETVPVTFLLSVYVAAGRKPVWRLVGVSSFGSALGALFLASAFHLWGFKLLFSYYPDLIATPAWTSIELWISKFGMFAIAGIAAVPLPLTPAIALCGLMRMPLATLFASVLIGKIVKYSVTASLTLQAKRQFRYRDPIGKRGVR